MDKYKRYCVALNEKENEEFNQVKNKGYGVKKVFMQGIKTVEQVKVDLPDETE